MILWSCVFNIVPHCTHTTCITCIYTYTFMHLYIHITYTHIYTYKLLHTYIHIILLTYTYTHTHTHTGLVADCPLTDYIPSTCSPQTSDNDGLWTSLLVVAESLRYQVTKDPQAQSNAWALFKGMKFLNDVCHCASS